MGTSSQLSAAQQNALAAQAVLSQSVEMMQLISTQTVNPANQNQLQIIPRNVGLLKRFIVVVKATVANTDTALAADLTDFGLSNLLSNVQFTDLNNNQRINTTGAHLANLMSLKQRRPFGGSASYSAPLMTDGQANTVWPVLVAPASIAFGTSAAVRAVFEIPLAYDDHDLRGAIYANVVNATMQLSLTLNPTIGAAANTDTSTAVYAGTKNVSVSSATVEVYQVYLDQLPVSGSGVVLPMADLSTVYELKTSPFQAIAQGVDFPVPFANFRDFLSVFTTYDNNNQTSTGRETGGDINYWALQSANFTNIWKKSPLIVAMETRHILGRDLPAGCYYHSFRRKPISTVQYGNMELVINPSTAGPNSTLTVNWEDFAYLNSLTQAGSLAG